MIGEGKLKVSALLPSAKVNDLFGRPTEMPVRWATALVVFPVCKFSLFTTCSAGASNGVHVSNSDSDSGLRLSLNFQIRLVLV